MIHCYYCYRTVPTALKQIESKIPTEEQLKELERRNATIEAIQVTCDHCGQKFFVRVVDVSTGKPIGAKDNA